MNFGARFASLLLCGAILTPTGLAQATTPYPDFLFDYDRDGEVDAEDLLLLLQGIATFPNPTPTATPVNSANILVDLPGLVIKMIRIPAGSFMMGSPDTERSRGADEGPVHEVTIDNDFHMSETEITQAQWEAVMGYVPGVGPTAIGNTYPAFSITWDDCQAFIETLNRLGKGDFRLPSEAEWEYACRAGTTTRFYFGDSLDCGDICEDCNRIKGGSFGDLRSHYLWYCFNSMGRPNPVKQLLPNSFGLYDMAGNVAEWCRDPYHADYTGAPNDGSAWESGGGPTRVIRGGDFDGGFLGGRSAGRFGNSPDNVGREIGFRIAGTPFPPPPDSLFDHDQDGDVDYRDLFIFSHRWSLHGIVTPPSPTPTETPTGPPSSLVDLPGPFIKMIRIPAGSFMMGSPDSERSREADEGPAHQVTIDYDFYLSETEVTQEQWETVMGYNAATHTPNGMPLSATYGVGPDYPVYNVSYYDCQDFISVLNDLREGTYRLPSEAEWEYAARAGSTTRFFFGNSLGCPDECEICDAAKQVIVVDQRSDYMWYCGNSAVTTQPVRQRFANLFGLYDMSGNVWEWCEDCYHVDYSAAPTDGSAWKECDGTIEEEGVHRGGSWIDPALSCRSADRDKDYFGDPYIDGGFRLAWTP